MVHARDRLGERAEHRDLILDPEREQVSRSRGHLDAGPWDVEWLQKMREEHPVLAPGERGYQCGTGPVGERDVRRGQERLASEELDALADAGYCSVREEAEHTAPPKDAVDAESRIH